MVDISYQYWSRRRPVLVRIPPPLLVVTAFRYSYIYIDTACTTTLPQGDKSTYIGRWADLYWSDDETI